MHFLKIWLISATFRLVIFYNLARCTKYPAEESNVFQCIYPHHIWSWWNPHVEFFRIQSGLYCTITPLNIYILGIMWLKQCHKSSPSHHHFFLGGMYKPCPVMGGANGIVLPILCHIQLLFGLLTASNHYEY